LDKSQGIFRNFASESEKTNLHLVICTYILAIKNESISQLRKWPDVKSVPFSLYGILWSAFKHSTTGFGGPKGNRVARLSKFLIIAV